MTSSPAPARICADCGEPFRRRGPGLRCTPCGDEARAYVPHPKFRLDLSLWASCPVCSERFEMWNVEQRCCSISCANRIRRGLLKPERRRVWVAGWCPSCGDAFVSAHVQSRYCSPVCEKRESRRVRRDRKRAAHVERVYRRRVYERDGWICRLCLDPVDRDAVVPAGLAPTLDHILPLGAQGRHEYANVQCAHFICNSRKGARGDAQLSFAA